jgi:predicted O-linked N-acetylglucosamine transferase (SPINDLY family)
MEDFTSLLRAAEQQLNGGALAEAERLIEACLALQPDEPHALYLHGVILCRSQHMAEGLALIRRSTEALPEHPEIWFGLARLAEQAKEHSEAALAYRRAVTLAPEQADYWFRLGRLLARRPDPTEGIAALRRALTIEPTHGRALHTLGLTMLTRGHLEEADAIYAKLLALDPHDALTLGNLGTVRIQQGRFTDAVAALSRSVQLRPDSAHAQSGLGIALLHNHQLEAAVGALSEAIRLNPKDARLYSNLSVALEDQVRHEEADAALQQAIRLDSSLRGPWDNLLMGHFYRAKHDPALCFEQHKAWGVGIEATLPGAARPPARRTRAGRTLRVGLVSPDFRSHPVGTFIEPIIAGMEHARVELVCFSNHVAADSTTERLRTSAREWHAIHSLGDDQAAALIARQEIDLLVDLAGHTTGNRLGLFARQPAPLQATYLGYPGTTGLGAIHGRITDAIADPPGLTERFHTERLIRLPDCFLCYRPPAYAPRPAQIGRHGAPLTFGSFNNLKKLNHDLIEAWAMLLDAVPGARLMLKSAPLGDEATGRRIAALFTAAGADPTRLVLRGRVSDPAHHLAAYDEIDIALDSFPYNGTTTTCEALWMGVPVIALAGASHVSRVGTSLLRATGLEELVASSVADYVRLAAALAKDAPRRSALRADLRARMAASVLMDERRFCANLAEAFEAMVRDG